MPPPVKAAVPGRLPSHATSRGSSPGRSTRLRSPAAVTAFADLRGVRRIAFEGAGQSRPPGQVAEPCRSASTTPSWSLFGSSAATCVSSGGSEPSTTAARLDARRRHGHRVQSVAMTQVRPQTSGSSRRRPRLLAAHAASRASRSAAASGDSAGLPRERHVHEHRSASSPPRRPETDKPAARRPGSAPSRGGAAPRSGRPARQRTTSTSSPTSPQSPGERQVVDVALRSARRRLPGRPGEVSRVPRVGDPRVGRLTQHDLEAVEPVGHACSASRSATQRASTSVVVTTPSNSASSSRLR